MNTDAEAVLAASLRGYFYGFIEALPRLGLTLVILLATWGVVVLIGWSIGKLGPRARLRPSLVSVFQMLTAIAVWIGGTLVAITVLFPSVTPANAIAAIGLGSVAIGFAFKDIFENFLAGVLLLFREPFRLGDFIESNDVEGQVESITVRDTHLRQTDGQLVVMPNSVIFKNPITVRTDRQFRRTTIICGIAYDEDVDAARKVIFDAVKHVDSVRDDVRDVQVFAKAFGESSIDFEVAWWTGSRPVDIRASRDEVVAAIKRALDDAGIEIPFPYRTLTFKQDYPFHMAGEEQQERQQETAG